MKCNDAEELISPWIDGELEPRLANAVAAHIAECQHCMTHAAAIGIIAQRVRDAFAPPAVSLGLRRRIGERTFRKDSPYIWRALAVSAAMAAAAVYLFASPLFLTPFAVARLAKAHQASMESGSMIVGVPVDRLGPLFAEKGAVAPLPKDFADRGFKLLGGRMTNVAGQTGNALIYQAKDDIISLFISPAPDQVDRPPISYMVDNIRVIRWSDDGRLYAAVSSMEQNELDRFVKIACAEL